MLQLSSTALITPATSVFFKTITTVVDLFPDSDWSANYDFDLISTWADWAS